MSRRRRRFVGVNVVVAVVEQHRKRHLQVGLKTDDQVLEGQVDGLGQEVLGRVGKGSNVSVGLEEVEDLGGVGHPKCEIPGIALVRLDDAVDLISDVVQHVR